MTEPEILTPAMLTVIHTTTEHDHDCDDCFALVDEAVETLLAGEDEVDEAFVVHLRICGPCYDEAKALAEQLADDRGLDSAAVIERLAAAVRD